MKIRLTKLKDKSKNRPVGYVEDVISKGTVSGDFLFITPNAYRELQVKYNSETPQIQSVGGCCKKMPPVVTQIKNAMGAVGRVVHNAITFQDIKASPEDIQKRKSICESCEFLDVKRKRCSKCGCKYNLKLQLASEHCPVNKW